MEKRRIMQFNQWSKEDMNKEGHRRRATIKAIRAAQTGTALAQAIRDHTVTHARAMAWAEGMIFMGERVELYQEALDEMTSLN